MAKFSRFSLFLFLLGLASSGKLPPSFTKCNRKHPDFATCLPKSAQNAIAQMTKPIKELGLTSLVPLEIPAITLPAGKGPVDFQQNFKNVKAWGFDQAVWTKLNVDFDKKVLDAEVVFLQVKLEFEYEFDGKVLLLPITGKGPGTIILDKLETPFTFTLEEYDNKGAKHFKVVDTKLRLEPKLMKYEFDNLFNGDEASGNNINKVLNDNWKEVFDDVKHGYEEAVAQFFKSVLENVLKRVSIDDLFGE